MVAGKWWAGALTILVLPATITAQQVPTVTLDEAIEMAIRVQPAVVQARGALTSAHAGQREVLGSWLPSLSTSGSWARNSTTTRIDQTTQTEVSSPPYSYSAGWNTSIDIFDGFRRFAQGRSASADFESADANLTNQQFQVTLQLKQTFFNALAADELIRVSETRVQRADEQLKVSKEKLAAGSATRSDTLRSAVELGNARLQLLNAQTSQASTRAALARLIGYDGAVQAVADSGLFVMAPLDTAALRDELLRSSPSVIAADANAKAAAASVAVARSQYFPTLRGTFSQNWSGTDIGRLGSSWAARLSLNWSIFNGFAREGTITRSAVSRENAQAQADDARRQASAQLTQQLAILAGSRAQIDIAQASLAAAQEDLRVVQERYRLGAATIVDVLTSQITLDQAEVDVIRAGLDFLVARAQLEALLGRAL
ncbi:MAG: TolC family protein [Gemmatimonadota bacterium]|nr:TolC family protein [Gemmatimonadota bacterium]MDH4349791.1 TolC family protein [Gemmatimonadota bacterium]MDH5196137.1 TolC family protein [Gemmatimonadota bacterium]